MGYLTSTAALMKKVALLQKYSTKVFVTKNSISSSNICLLADKITDSEFALYTKDLCELMKTGSNFEIEDDTIFYSQQCTVGSSTGTVCKKFDLLDLRYNYNFGSATCTLKVSKYQSITSDKTLFTYCNGRIFLESDEYVKTRISFLASKIEGCDFFQIKVKGTDLKIVNEIEEEKIISFYGDYLVVFGIGNSVTTAVIIRSIK